MPKNRYGIGKVKQPRYSQGIIDNIWPQNLTKLDFFLYTELYKLYMQMLANVSILLYSAGYKRPVLFYIFTVVFWHDI